MTPCLDLVADGPKARPNTPSFDPRRYSRGSALTEGLRANIQIQANAATGSREVAVSNGNSEVAMKQTKVRDERAGNSLSSPLKPTSRLVQDGLETTTIDINAGRVLLALAFAVCLAGPLAWAFVRYWLFAP
jgi:hypothetical protein